MQNMAVDSLIEKIKTKIVIEFYFINFMTYLALVANSMVIFSASYKSRRIVQELSGNDHRRFDLRGRRDVLRSAFDADRRPNLRLQRHGSHHRQRRRRRTLLPVREAKLRNDGRRGSNQNRRRKERDGFGARGKR